MIVVFGSINLDIVTRVPTIPKPGETVLGPSYIRVPGGKGANQALAARRAGAKVALVGATGLDEFADAALSLLLTEGVDCSAVARKPLPTGAAFISIDSDGQNAITVASGANAAVLASQLEPLPIDVSTVLLLQREVPDQEGEAAAALVRAARGRTILNLAPAGDLSERYLELVDILIMNEHEAAALAGFRGLGGEFGELASHLHQRFSTDTVVTLGGEGAMGWHGGEPVKAPARPVTVVDTTAAGDTFTGAFAAGLESGFSFEDSLRRGVVAGSLACTRLGAQTSIPTKAEIDAALV